MDFESFPDIENFQKLPHQVLIKGGVPSYESGKGAELRGIVINNIGNQIGQLRVHLVLFDENRIPVFSTSAVPEPSVLPQGGIGAFMFELKDYPKAIEDHYLYTSWRFQDE
ncbi:MAG: hypothetical protein A2Z83_03535 [Omnitrophica bacterium GWA2_52_8]|nr:MAG: hypothetical protein A2Z83_03535 [Omnitrophica bacterium GWA2_52_8]